MLLNIVCLLGGVVVGHLLVVGFLKFDEWRAVRRLRKKLWRAYTKYDRPDLAGTPMPRRFGGDL